MHPHSLRTIVGGIALALSSPLSHAADLVGQWKLDNGSAPYTATVGSSSLTNQNISIAGSGAISPVGGNSASLVYTDPGPSTSLATSGSALSTNSFGFSVWVNPSFLGAFDNFFGQANQSGAPDPAWQVHLLGDNGFGFASLEFVVRGDTSGTTGFAASTSTALFKLGGGQSGNWVNIAGGYNASTGATSLFVNGTEFANPIGDAGMTLAGGAPFFLGTGYNGTNPVAFAAGTSVWDARLYDSPLTQLEVNAIIIAAVPEPSTYGLLFGIALFALVGRRIAATRSTREA